MNIKTDQLAPWSAYVAVGIGPLIVMRSSSMYNLPLTLRSLQSSVNTELGALMTGAVVTTLQLVVLFIMSSRQLISGLSGGAVK